MKKYLVVRASESNIFALEGAFEDERKAVAFALLCSQEQNCEFYNFYIAEIKTGLININNKGLAIAPTKHKIIIYGNSKEARVNA